MQITLTDLPGLERKLEVTFPANLVTNKVLDKLRALAPRVKMPGFRVGKVPFELVKQNYSDSARAEVLQELVKEHYLKGVEQYKLSPVGLPQINFTHLSDQDEEVSFTATFEVYPEVKLADLTQVSVEKPVSQLSEEQIAQSLERMRKVYAEWSEVTDAEQLAVEGDKVEIDFEMVAKQPSDQEPITPKTEQGVSIVLGSGNIWKEFEQQLYGMAVGDERTFTLLLPETHIDKAVAGREMEFHVKLTKLSKPLLPQLDDEFAAKLNLKEGGVAQLKENIRTYLDAELNRILEAKFKQALFDRLLEAHDLVVPKAWVEQELKRQQNEWQARHKANLAAYNGNTTETEHLGEFPVEEFRESAVRNVSLGVLMSAIAQEHKLKIELAEVRKKIDDLMAESGRAMTEDEVEKILRDKGRMNNLQGILLEEKIVNHLASNMQVVEKSISCDELIGKL